MKFTIEVTEQAEIDAIKKAMILDGLKDENEYIQLQLKQILARDVRNYVNVCPTCKRPL